MWERDASLPERVANAWADAGPKSNLKDVHRGLGKVMGQLQQWSKLKFGAVTKEIEQSRNKLEELMRMNADRNEIRAVTDKMNELLYREEMMWMQRSRINWLKEGDKNTKFFHSRAIWRARKNRIKRLKDDAGEWQSDPKVLGDMATSYFRNLFEADQTLDPTPLIHLFEEKISPEMNTKLCEEFTDKEISDALFQIGPLKAPGPDGFPARFFQRNWGTLKEEIIVAVKEFFKTGSMPPGINDTSIVLIPKVDDPEGMSQFRPISLCNVIYKVISKCLVNRMRPILGDIISQAQSAFVPGRLITDNALLAFECIHHINQEKRPGKEYCAYKLDLSKAYNRVDWGFLKQVMMKLGFARQWVQWIMSCVTSVRYSVKFNGALLDSFAPSRGLRQGDPLSPFLFLFVADGLSALLKQGVDNEEIEPVKVCPGAPGVSHLLFADDTILFFKASRVQAEHVNQILETYANATGQLINRSKCSILFGTHCPAGLQEEVKEALHVQADAFEEKYLGLPTPDGRMHKGKFQNLQEMLTQIIMLWGDGLPSQGGKEILIKAVAQAIPTYIMGVFKLPRSVCDDLTRLVRNFWWGSGKGQRKTHWQSWDKVTLPKALGGLGFRDFRLFNQALLARQAWRLLTVPHSLCAQVLKAKYYPRGQLQDTVFSANASPAWQGVQHGLDLLKKGLIWRIGNGNQIRIWRDPWIPRPHTFRPVSKQRSCRLRRVSELLNGQGEWNMHLLHRYFKLADVEAISQMKPPSVQHEDVLSWAHTHTGVFTVKSAYWLAMEETNRPIRGATSGAPDGQRAIWKSLWGCPAPRKVHIFAWRLATNSLATWENKMKRNMEVTDTCVVCGVECESTYHTFCRCPLAVSLWSAMAEEWGLPDLADITNTGSEWLLNLLDHKSETMRTMILMTLWRIWHVRNEVVHHKPAPTIESSKRFLCSYLESLISIKSAPNADVVKGKTIVSAHYSDKKEKQISPTADPLKKWCKPQPGTIKLNVDGSFNATLRNGGCGIVLRDDRGAIIFSACKHLDRCADPLEAELSACREGILKVQQADARPCIIEMDSAEAVTMIQEKRLNRSHVTFIVEEIKRLLQVRPSMELVAISRDLNSVSHLLANIGRSQIRSMFWRGSGPENVVALCHEDADD
jgi:ribonuclease HI